MTVHEVRMKDFRRNDGFCEERKSERLTGGGGIVPDEKGRGQCVPVRSGAIISQSSRVISPRTSPRWAFVLRPWTFVSILCQIFNWMERPGASLGCTNSSSSRRLETNQWNDKF